VRELVVGRAADDRGAQRVEHLVADRAAHGARGVDVDLARDELLGGGDRGDLRELLAEPLDAWSPCALGGAVTPEIAATSGAAIVCGGANNQLATPAAAVVLAGRGILYCPDFCGNAGGVIQVADEVHGFSFERAKARTAGIYDTTLDVLEEARASSVTPVTAARRRAERRMADIGGLGRILKPR
jgi:valine dehydrogenase (NAD+)